jgi:hypothetical protein
MATINQFIISDASEDLVPLEDHDGSMRFEFTVERMFPAAEFSTVVGEDACLSPRLRPFMRFHHLRTGQEIMIICHYQRKAPYNKVEWCRPEELDRYHSYLGRLGSAKVYLVIGLGGEPSHPDRLFSVPLDQAKWSALYLPVLKLFEHDINKSLSCADGRLM